MRNLLFWLICARAGQERAARPAVASVPVWRKLRRVTGEREMEVGFVFMVSRAIMHGRSRASSKSLHEQDLMRKNERWELAFLRWIQSCLAERPRSGVTLASTQPIAM